MKKALFLVFGIAFAVLSPAKAVDFSVSLASGLFSSSQDAYRELYGTGIPLALDLWIGVSADWGVSIGLLRLTDAGMAFDVNGAEDNPVDFRRLSIPCSLYYRVEGKKIAFVFGAGFSYSSYREKWRNADLTFRSAKWGPVVYAAIERVLVGRVSFFGTIRYERIPTGFISPFVGKVDLDGFSALAGLSCRVLQFPRIRSNPQLSKR